jgi:hypothetical protein
LASGIELGEVLEIGQGRVTELQLLQVLDHGGHLGELLGVQEGDRIPVPFVMEDLTVQPHGVVRRDQVAAKGALAAGRDDQLLGARIHVKLGVRFVPTLEVNWGGLRKVNNKTPLLQLVNMLLNWNHLKGT